MTAAQAPTAYDCNRAGEGQYASHDNLRGTQQTHLITGMRPGSRPRSVSSPMLLSSCSRGLVSELGKSGPPGRQVKPTWPGAPDKTLTLVSRRGGFCETSTLGRALTGF